MPPTANTRNLVICLATTYILFLVGSSAVLVYVLPLLPGRFVHIADRGLFVIELGGVLTVLVSLIAIPLGFAYMYFFGGVVSPWAMRLYLYLTRGKHIVLPGNSADPKEKVPVAELKLRRQVLYFLFLLAVAVSFAFYLAKQREPLVAPIGQASDAASLLTGDFVTLTMWASLMVATVSLALPYFGGLRLRSIDAGPFHTTILTSLIGFAGGISLVYAVLTRPGLENIVFYTSLFLGVCWSFATGCNLGAEPANRVIIREVFSAKPNSRLLSSKIWLENPPGKLVEI